MVERYVIWGAGDIGTQFYKHCVELDLLFRERVICFVDKDSSKWKETVDGIEICSPDVLGSLEDQYKIIVCTHYYDEVVSYVTQNYNVDQPVIYFQFFYDKHQEIIKRRIEKYSDIILSRMNALQQKLYSLLHLDVGGYDELLTYKLYTLLDHRHAEIAKLLALRDQQIYSKRIAINSLHLYFPELSLAYLYAVNGCTVHYFYKSRTVIQPLEGSKYAPKSLDILTASIEELYLKEFYAHPNMKFLEYRECIGAVNDTVENLYTTKHAISSTRRMFKTDDIDLNETVVKHVYQQQLKQATESYYLGKYIYEHLEIDTFITSHGIYSLWGPCFSYLRDHNIHSVVYGTHSYNKEKWIIIKNAVVQFANESLQWKDFRNQTLKKDQYAEIDEYMKNRSLGNAQDTQIYYSKVNKEIVSPVMEKIIKFKGDKKLFCAFPNVSWDGAETDRDIVFNNLIDWLQYTIQAFEQELDAKLIVRFHPAESTLHSSVKNTRSFLEERMNLSSLQNTLFIDCDEELLTYDMFDYLDCGIIYNGFLGIELPYNGIPVITCGNGSFAVRNINFPIDSKESYVHSLKKIIEKPDDIIKYMDNETIYKFLYWYLKKTAFYYPFLESVLGINKYDEHLNLEIISNASLKETLDFIVSR